MAVDVSVAAPYACKHSERAVHADRGNHSGAGRSPRHAPSAAPRGSGLRVRAIPLVLQQRDTNRSRRRGLGIPPLVRPGVQAAPLPGI
jgi:hypothetical protein